MFDIKITNKIENIICVESLYSLFLYEKIMVNFDNTLLLTSDRLPSIILNNFPNYICIKHDMFSQSLLNEGIKGRVLHRFGGYYPPGFESIKEIIEANGVKKYGHDHILISCMLKKKDIIIIEDGLANYVKQKYTISQKAFPFMKVKGYSFLTKKIYLTGLMDIPSELKYKYEIINIKIINNKSIFNDFSRDFINIKKIIITQPFFDDGYLSESEHINLYKKLYLNKLSMEIFIKPHPRDSIDYSFLSENILDKNIPIEIIYQTAKLTDIYSVNSTASYTAEILCNNVRTHKVINNDLNRKNLLKLIDDKDD